MKMRLPRTHSIIFFLLTLNSQYLSSQTYDYKYKRRIDEVTASGFYSIPLIPSVTAKMLSGTADVRLLHVNGNDTAEIPYLFEWQGDKIETVAVPFQRINDTYNEKCCSYVTLKFPSKTVVNRIKLDIEEPEFDKRIKIEGSNDGKEWFTIAEHQRIVRFRSTTENYSYTTLDFENSEYTYYRLKFDDDGSKKVTVVNAYAFITKALEGTYSRLESKILSVAEKKDRKTTEIVVKLKERYLINYMKLSVPKDQDFYRNMNVYASSGSYQTVKGEEESWYIIHSSVLSSRENEVFNFANEATDKIKIEVINHDNPPVKIKDVVIFGEQCRLVAKLPATGITYLVYGKTGENAPDYDLVHFRDKIPTDLKDILYSDETPFAVSAKAGGPLISNRAWLWGVITVVIIVIGYFSLNMLRKEQQNKES